MSAASQGTQNEHVSGLIIEVSSGDLLIGALGFRSATPEAAGSWRNLTDDQQVQALTAAGIIGRVTLRSTLIPKPIGWARGGQVAGVKVLPNTTIRGTLLAEEFRQKCQHFCADKNAHHKTSIHHQCAIGRVLLHFTHILVDWGNWLTNQWVWNAKLLDWAISQVRAFGYLGFEQRFP